MHSGMYAAIDDFEILDSVIAPVVVPVMDRFFRQEFPTEMALHYDSMFVLMGSFVRGNGNVAIWTHGSAAFPNRTLGANLILGTTGPGTMNSGALSDLARED